MLLSEMGDDISTDNNLMLFVVCYQIERKKKTYFHKDCITKVVVLRIRLMVGSVTLIWPVDPLFMLCPGGNGGKGPGNGDVQLQEIKNYPRVNPVSKHFVLFFTTTNKQTNKKIR